MDTLPKIDLAATSARFAAALATEARLGLHLAKLDARIAAAQASLRALASDEDSRAAAMLSSTDLDTASTGGEAGLRDEINRLSGDRSTTLRAIGLARQETSSARGEASAEVCRGLLPEYRERVDALAHALLATYEAHRAVDALTDSLDLAGAGWTGILRPMPIKLFRETGFSDALPSWIREAKLHRLTSAEFPVEWVRAWNTPAPAEAPLDHSGDGMSIVKYFRRR